ncbi:MAG: AraC family transcriptional regulator [Clostridia bacterium]|nr:AraC family transcriptional regulator [Clostridia bacterium]NCC42734.1 AraC family transcriptional regulator [Clostridia bacterium]
MSKITNVSVEKNLKENSIHGDYSFPVDIHKDYFPPSTEGRQYYIPSHWHPEIEFLLVTEGNLHYQVNLEEYDLAPGEAIFVNANQLHSGYPTGDGSTRMHSIIFHPKFFYGSESSLIYQKYVQPLLDNTAFPSFHLGLDDEEQAAFLSLLQRCYYLHKDKPENWELDVLASVVNCWSKLWHLSCNTNYSVPVTKKSSRDRQNIKSLLDFIQTHYMEKLTLEDLSMAAALSPGECGRLCKRVLHQTPMNYLLSYRIEQSIPLLIKEDLSVTEIALKVGFSGSSYYAEIFHRFKGISPREFRRRTLY